MNELLNLGLHYEIQYTVTEEKVQLLIVKDGNIYNYFRVLPEVINVDDIEQAVLECIKEFYSEM